MGEVDTFASMIFASQAPDVTQGTGQVWLKLQKNSDEWELT